MGQAHPALVAARPSDASSFQIGVLHGDPALQADKRLIFDKQNYVSDCCNGTVATRASFMRRAFLGELAPRFPETKPRLGSFIHNCQRRLK
jgi:hypothetical protein